MKLQETNHTDENTLECEEYKILFDSIDDGYCVIEMYMEPNEPLDYKFIEINKAFESQSTLKDAKGKWIRELLPELEESWFEIYREVALSRQPIRFENRGKALEDRWFSVYAFAIGKPEQHRVAVLFRDISHQKHAEAQKVALQKGEERLRIALEAAGFGTWELNLVSGIYFHNLRHDQVFGYNNLQPKWTLETTLQHVLPDDREMVLKAHQQADENGKMGLEARIVWKDNSIHWINLHGRFQFDHQGKAVKIIGIISDITERKNAEATLKKNELHLLELNATKDKFFSIIAHDLKSPFNSIIGLSEVLVENIMAKEYEEAEKYASIIQKSSNLAMNLLTNLFEWSKLQTGKIEFNPTENDIVSVIKETSELLSESAGQKSVTISLETPDSYSILFDLPMISTVLRNLLSNAIKFSHPNEEIIISALPSADELVISVSDKGIGIKQDKIEKLFHIGEIVSTPGTTGEQGSGLGLLLCKEFVTKHSGRIWVESEEGKGSKFSFSLPGRQSA